MKNQKGITLITLTITVIVLILIAGITIKYSSLIIIDVKLQDLKTNMLLIQAKTKEYVEEVNFQTANITDEAQIQTIYKENLRGLNLAVKEDDNQENKALKQKIRAKLLEINAVQENELDLCYYLDTDELSRIGLVDIKKDGYYVVIYDIGNIKVEVINTNGFKDKDGKKYYTLTELNNLTNED